MDKLLYHGRLVKVEIPKGGDPAIDATVCYTDEMIDKLNGAVARVVGYHHDIDGHLWAHLEGWEQDNGHGWWPIAPEWLTVVEA